MGIVTSIVDSSGNVGAYAAIAVDSSNNYHIAYYDATNADLKYAKWNGSSWNLEIVDSSGGEYIDIVLDSNEYPHISYVVGGNLKHANWTGSEWGIDVVDTITTQDMTSIDVYSNDYSGIAYRDQSTADLKYAKFNGMGWDLETVQSVGSVGQYPSLVIDSSDKPHIAHRNASTNNLAYAYYNGVSWELSDIFASNVIGTSIKLNSSGQPCILFPDGSKIKYTVWNGATWDTEDGPSGSHSEINLVLDSFDKPSYVARDYPGSTSIVYGYKDGTWTQETIKSGLGTGDAQVSIALNSLESPIIAFYNPSTDDLEIAYDADVEAPTWEGGTPSISSLADTTVDVDVQINEAGTAYSVAVADGATAPTSEEVKAGVDYGGTGVLPDIESDTIGYYRGENNANSETGANNGSWNGTPSYASGIPAIPTNALDFSGGSYVSLDTTGFPSGTSPYTISFWVNIDSFGSAWAKMVSFGSTSVTPRLHITREGSTNNLAVQFEGGGIATGVATITGGWHHIVVSKAASTCDIYVDNVFKVQITNVGPGMTPQYFTIGVNGNNLNEWMDGQIDELIILDRAINAGEVSALYNATASYFGGGSAVTVISSDSTPLSASTPGVLNHTGLTPSTAYDVYTVAEDDEGTPNLQATPVKLDVTTTAGADVTPPEWISAPAFLEATENSIDITDIGINEDGYVYCVVVPDGSAVPTPAQVEAGTDGDDIAATYFSGAIDCTGGSHPSDVSATGLAASTVYDIYLIGKDDADNLMLSVYTILNQSTDAPADTTPPTWEGTTPDENTTGGTTSSINVEINEAGIAYGVVVPDGASAPSVVQIKAGQDSTGTPVASGFSANVALSASTPDTLSFSNLVSETAYDVYVVAEDEIPNLQLSASKIDILTTDITGPVWEGETPTVNRVHLPIAVEASENGNAYLVVLADGATAPSSAQVKAGQDATSTPVDITDSVALVASTEATMKIAVEKGSDYDVYIVSEDSLDNLQDNPTKLDINI